MGQIKTRLGYEQRESIIISTGVIIANRDGLNAVNHTTIAAECPIKTSIPTVRFYFRRNSDLWRAVAMHDNVSNDVRSEAIALGVI